MAACSFNELNIVPAEPPSDASEAVKNEFVAPGTIEVSLAGCACVLNETDNAVIPFFIHRCHATKSAPLGS